MDKLIKDADIDAKHSNEDPIAPFREWVERYGRLIGNFGGLDTDILVQFSESEIKKYVKDLFELTAGKKGIAIGSGNSIPDYIPPEGYLAMVEAVREYRGI
jgi:uroporphyrinogen decarboxylase